MCYILVRLRWPSVSEIFNNLDQVICVGAYVELVA